MKKFLAVFLVSLSTLGFTQVPGSSNNVNHWNEEFIAFEKNDILNNNNIVFLGSSSIRLWKTLETDFSFADARVLNRGFGGSTIKDCVLYTDKLILKQRPEYVIIYAGDNDLASGSAPDDVIDNLSKLVRNIRSITPESKIAYISIKPSPARQTLLPLIERTNQMAKRWTQTHAVTFIDIYQPMLKDGNVRPELFLPDQLHMNHMGYEIWTEAIRSALNFQKTK